MTVPDLDALRSRCERLFDRLESGDLTHEDGFDMGVSIADDALVVIAELATARRDALLEAAAIVRDMAEKINTTQCIGLMGAAAREALEQAADKLRFLAAKGTP